MSETGTGAELPTATPVRSKRIDLDAARKARREARGEDEIPVVVVDGVELELPAELPADALAAFGAIFAAGSGDDEGAQIAALSSLSDAAACLFGEAWEPVRSKGLSLDDLAFLIESALEVYGVHLGESRASGSSS